MKNWYIVQSYSSFEKKVADAIKKEAIKNKLKIVIDNNLIAFLTSIIFEFIRFLPSRYRLEFA